MKLKLMRTTEIGQILTEMRKENYLSLRDVASQLGISHKSIVQYENGRIDVGGKNLKKLIDLYGYEMDFHKKLD